MSDPTASAAPEAPNPSPYTQEALNALTPEARSTYESTGDWPEPAKVTTTAPAAASDEPDEDEPAVAPVAAPEASAAAPVPTPEKPVSKRQQHINDLMRRAAESDQRAAALEAKLAALEGRVAPAAEPEPAATPAPVIDPSDPEPLEADFDDYRSFVKATAKWEIRQAQREALAESEAAQRAQAEMSRLEAFQSTAKTWIGRRDDFLAKHPDKAEAMVTFLDGVHPGTPIGDVILESEVGAEIADYLAFHPQEAERIARLAPISALRALGKLEAKFDPESPLSSASASAGPAAGKTVTSAPAAPTTLTPRSAIPADPSADALARKDFAAFEREENRKALAGG